MLQKFIAAGRRWGFTRNEAVVVLFLSLAAMAGGITRLLTPPAQRHSLEDAYRRHDSVFAARSAALMLPRIDSTGDEPHTSRRVSSADDEPARGSINPNTAATATLATLPGIGPAIAQRIVEYRNSHGPYEKVDDLMSVKGIGPKKFERIKPYLSVSRPSAPRTDG